MEDCCSSVQCGPVSAVGVFDGHNGNSVAQHASDAFPAAVEASLHAHASAPEQAMASLVAALDTAPPVDPSAPVPGSTATVAMVGATDIVVGWVGDSGAVLARSGSEAADAMEVVSLTVDHTPSRSATECERVAAEGGSVRAALKELDNGDVVPFGVERVYLSDGSGGLTLTRALGNHHLRPVVSPKPDSVRVARQPRDRFLLLCSDGVWDVLNQEVYRIRHDYCILIVLCFTSFVVSQEACQEAWSVLRRGGGARAAAHSVVEQALTRSPSDNCTAAVIDLRVFPCRG
jgi:protein phosphatase 2C